MIPVHNRESAASSAASSAAAENQLVQIPRGFEARSGFDPPGFFFVTTKHVPFTTDH